MSIYQTYRLQAKLLHGAISPWQADTLFGAFCWAYAYQYGEEAFNEFLSTYKNNTPRLIISNGFPGNFLPRPLLTMDQSLEEDENKKKRLQSIQESKWIKKINYIDKKEFNTIQHGKVIKIDFSQKLYSQEQVINTDTFHNQISRFTDTTGEEGAFFHLHEWYAVPGVMSVYLKIERGFEADVKGTLEIMGQRGIGKKHNLNRGAFQVEKFDIYDEFAQVDTPNSFISLSNFIPAADDPVDGNYKTFVKYGKTDLGNNPFKSGIIMLQSGSVFKLNGEFKPFYGRMVQNLTADNRVYQYGLSFAVPAKIDWESS